MMILPLPREMESNINQEKVNQKKFHSKELFILISVNGEKKFSNNNNLDR